MWLAGQAGYLCFVVPQLDTEISPPFALHVGAGEDHGPGRRLLKSFAGPSASTVRRRAWSRCRDTRPRAIPRTVSESVTHARVAVGVNEQTVGRCAVPTASPAPGLCHAELTPVVSGGKTKRSE